MALFVISIKSKRGRNFLWFPSNIRQTSGFITSWLNQKRDNIPKLGRLATAATWPLAALLAYSKTCYCLLGGEDYIVEVEGSGLMEEMSLG